MRHKGFGLLMVFALVMGMSVGAWAQTVCDGEEFYADYTAGITVDKIDWWANLLKEVPIDIENLEIGLPMPDDFPIEIDSALLTQLEPFIFGIHTFDFSLSTTAELIEDAQYALTAASGQVTISLDLGVPGGGNYIEADVSFGNVASDCSMYDTILEIPLWTACKFTEGVFNLLIENEDVYFVIDTIDVVQKIDTCVVHPEGGRCKALAQVASTQVTQSGFALNSDLNDFMDALIGFVTKGMVSDFIRLAFSPDGDMSTLLMLYPHLTSGSDGCSPPPQVAECNGGGCSTTPKTALRQSSKKAVSLVLYLLPMAAIFGLIIRRRKK